MEEKTNPAYPPPYENDQPQQPPYPQQAPTTAQPQPQPQPMPGPGVIQVSQQPATILVSVPMKFTPLPANVQCPNCGNNVTTETHKEVGGVTWLTAGAVCLFFLSCLLCPLGLVAFCIPALKDTIHTCPVCKFIVGKHSHI